MRVCKMRWSKIARFCCACQAACVAHHWGSTVQAFRIQILGLNPDAGSMWSCAVAAKASAVLEAKPKSDPSGVIVCIICAADLCHVTMC